MSLPLFLFLFNQKVSHDTLSICMLFHDDILEMLSHGSVTDSIGISLETDRTRAYRSHAQCLHRKLFSRVLSSTQTVCSQTSLQPRLDMNIEFHCIPGSGRCHRFNRQVRQPFTSSAYLHLYPHLNQHSI